MACIGKKFSLLLIFLFLTSFGTALHTSNPSGTVNRALIDCSAGPWENGRTYLLTQDYQVATVGTRPHEDPLFNVCFTFDGVSDITIDCLNHNLFNAEGTIGFDIRNSNNVRLQNCRIDGLGQAVRVEGGNDVTLAHNIISRSNVDAVWISGTNRAGLIGNVVTNNPRGLFAISAPNLLLAGNLFSDNRVGTELNGNTGLTASNNYLCSESSDLSCAPGYSGTLQGINNYLGTTSCSTITLQNTLTCATVALTPLLSIPFSNSISGTEISTDVGSASLVGTATWIPQDGVGIIPGAFRTTTPSSFITYGNRLDPNTPLNPSFLTLSFWFKGGSTFNVAWDTIQRTNQFMGISLSGRGVQYLADSNTASIQHITNFGTDWHHLAVTVASDGNLGDPRVTHTLYIDGQVVGTDQTNRLFPVNSEDSHTLRIGNIFGSEVVELDEVRIYGQPLTVTEIQNELITPYAARHPELLLHYDLQTPTVIDSSGRGNTGSQTGGSHITTEGIGSTPGSWQFNRDGYIFRDMSPLTEDLTVSFWARPDGDFQTGSFFQWGRTIAPEGDSFPYFIIKKDGDGWRFYVDGNYQLTLPDSAIALNRWHHFAVVKRKNQYWFYVDGMKNKEPGFFSSPLNPDPEPTPSYVDSNNFDRNLRNAHRIFFGSGHQAGFKGLIDEPRIYNRALTQEDIRNRLVLAGPAARLLTRSNLRIHYDFNTEQGSSIPDQAGNDDNGELNDAQGNPFTGSLLQNTGVGTPAASFQLQNGPFIKYRPGNDLTFSADSQKENDFAISFWFRSDLSKSEEGLFQWAQANTQSGSSFPYLLVKRVGSQVHYYVCDSSVNCNYHRKQPTGLRANIWHHVAITKTENVFRFFFDGQIVSNDLNGNPITPIGNVPLLGDARDSTLQRGQQLYFGTGHGGPLSGFIDEVRFYEGTFSDSDILTTVFQPFRFIGCGDLIVTSPEQCDGPNLNDQTCSTLGLSGTGLSCTATCTFDTSSCQQCAQNTDCNNGEFCSSANVCLAIGDLNFDNSINPRDHNLVTLYILNLAEFLGIVRADRNDINSAANTDCNFQDTNPIIDVRDVLALVDKVSEPRVTLCNRATLVDTLQDG